MNDDQKRRETYEQAVALLRPALERVVADSAFRARLEAAPLAVLDDLGVALDPATRSELDGKRFSEFWAARRRAVEGPVEVRELPPEEAPLADDQLEAVSGGITALAAKGPLPSFAPPYVPVGPVVMGDNLPAPGNTAASAWDPDRFRK